MPMQITLSDIAAKTLEVTKVMLKLGDSINLEYSLIIITGTDYAREIPHHYDCYS
ncbi:hypothetical protein [Candidatus Profftia tarda]|uniref:hypothetical protein n=1 Tax=Candidatus Profftia tarda TaxID=1177216 RepID=UPI001C1F4D0D|nr:hypothetical protein [Candidatus Profftia tarda]